jgi:hypothetical protein
LRVVLHHDQLGGALDTQARILDDHVRAGMLGHDLIAVALGHAESGEHGAVRGVEQGFQLGLAAAFDEAKLDQRHEDPPFTGLRSTFLP